MNKIFSPLGGLFPLTYPRIPPPCASTFTGNCSPKTSGVVEHVKRSVEQKCGNYVGPEDTPEKAGARKSHTRKDLAGYIFSRLGRVHASLRRGGNVEVTLVSPLSRNM